MAACAHDVARLGSGDFLDLRGADSFASQLRLRPFSSKQTSGHVGGCVAASHFPILRASMTTVSSSLQGGSMALGARWELRMLYQDGLHLAYGPRTPWLNKLHLANVQVSRRKP